MGDRILLAVADTRFVSQQKIRFGDVDHAGIVYYPRILHYCHVAMEDWLQTTEDLALHQLIGEKRWGSPVVGLKSSFHGPMTHGEIIEVHLTVEEIGNRSFTLGFRVCSVPEGKVCARVEVSHAMVNLKTFTTMDFPPAFRELLEG
jgi:YbgC/YbaW family acyl-CoA thioester hydrolase